MAKLVECIPNFSNGRDHEIIEAIVDEVRTTVGVTLLDYSSDTSHNRTVVTFIGSPEGVVEASVKLACRAATLIDLCSHTGEHPRMGAVDVIPFVPVKDISMDECIELSRLCAQRVWSEAHMPVFLYEESATAEHRKNLASIRKGQFEGMAKKVLEPEWEPDFGGRQIHPTAGAVAVGARMPLVAYNINLSTADLTIASNIAKIIRESSGGLKYVKALGVMLEDRNIAQVSINMTNFEKTPLYRVFELVRAEAKRYGVTIIGSEIIGLTPMNALVESAEYYLQLEGFDRKKQILENHIL